MKRLLALLRRVAGLFPNERRERELLDEIESHLEMHIDDNLRLGMSPEMARLAKLPSPRFARIEIGWLKAVQLQWDAIKHGWRRNVVGFNHQHQRSLWREWKIDRLDAWQYAALIALPLVMTRMSIKHAMSRAVGRRRVLSSINRR